MGASKHRDPVRRYYDRNTPRFLTLGHGSSAKAIHRAVWAPEITDREAAIHYVHTLISAYIAGTEAGRVLDIGCGVGGTILYLAERHSASFVGVTISPVQASWGNTYIEDSGLSGSCSVVPGDFCRKEILTDIGGGFDLAYVIEAFLHMSDPGCFFENAAASLRPGGILVVADDFLTPRGYAAEHRTKARRMVDSFRKGWHAGSLVTPEVFSTWGKQFGFTVKKNDNLTPFLELDRPRDLLLRPFAAILRLLPHSSPILSNIVGGDALQYCLKNDLVEHRFIVLHRENGESRQVSPAEQDP